MSDFASRRKWMVKSQLVARDISDARVLAAMNKVPRERFVPRHLRDYAYDDMPLGIGSSQTISQPYMVALMVQLLAAKFTDQVLEIGAGSGYGAAVIAELADSVVTVERIPELAKQAQKNLQGLGYSSVKVITGDGSLGYPPDAPYDGIVVTAGAPEVPLPLVSQLKYGGRMVIPSGSHRSLQKLLLVEKMQDDTITTSYVCDVRFVPLMGEEGWNSEQGISDSFR